MNLKLAAALALTALAVVAEGDPLVEIHAPSDEHAKGRATMTRKPS